MERHWQLVTRRLSSAVTADIAALIDIYESYPQDRDATTLCRASPSDRLQLDVDILPTRPAAAGPEAVLLDPRRGLVGRAAPPDRPALLDRHGRALELRRDPRQARRRQRHARARAAQPGLCLELAHLPRLDGRLVARAARRSRSCSCATRSGRSCASPRPRRASARAARSSSARAARARCARPATPSSK